MKSPLDALTFDNAFTRELPADPRDDNSRRQVADACFSRVAPTPVAKPQLIAHSREVATLLDLDQDLFASDDFADVFGGNRVLEGMDPFAMCYGGHQFGNWAGQLGDGRAINLGEVINRDQQRWMLQLKGAGPTPYSRTADGLAVLRSSLREFLCSEAMHHLGVPTTRALSLVLTGETVVRDMFYDGNPQRELGAVVCRVAPSFTRFGNFQLFASRGDTDTLRRLVDHTIKFDFPELCSTTHDSDPQELYAAWFHEICRRTADMIVHWMRVGFVHGVMNTDNMSILGLTIDYGPYGWLENYDPGWTPNTTDSQGRRYRYGHQPQIAQWNLMQLANALTPVFDDVEPLQQGLQVYVDTFERGWDAMMAAKLGLSEFTASTDEPLVKELLQVLQLAETDMTIFYRRLAQIDCEQDPDGDLDPLMDAYYDQNELTSEIRKRSSAWLRDYQARVRSDGTSNETRRERMNQVNPKYVLRNYLAQLAIDDSNKGDHQLLNELLEVLRNPYDEQSQHEKHAARRPEWARHRAGCSMLSCSS